MLTTTLGNDPHGQALVPGAQRSSTQGWKAMPI